MSSSGPNPALILGVYFLDDCLCGWRNVTSIPGRVVAEEPGQLDNGPAAPTWAVVTTRPRWLCHSRRKGQAQGTHITISSHCQLNFLLVSERGNDSWLQFGNEEFNVGRSLIHGVCGSADRPPRWIRIRNTYLQYMHMCLLYRRMLICICTYACMYICMHVSLLAVSCVTKWFIETPFCLCKTRTYNIIDKLAKRTRTDRLIKCKCT